MKVDLHIHTCFSDGGKSVQEIFDIASQKKVKILSITDHNNIDAYKNISAIDRHKIELINGIEIDAVYENVNIHIVMYDYVMNDEFKNYLQKSRNFDIAEFKRMIDSLEKAKNIKLESKEVENFINKNQYFDKVRLNNLLVELNYASSPVEAFYTLTKDIEDKKRFIITAEELFEISKKCGAKTFIAHPIKYLKNFDSFEALKTFMLRLRDIGLDGIEVFNNRQDSEQEMELLTFAKENNFLISAGSDFHAKFGGKSTKEIGKVLKKEITSDLVSEKLLKKFL